MFDPLYLTSKFLYISSQVELKPSGKISLIVFKAEITLQFKKKVAEIDSTILSKLFVMMI